MMAGRTRAGGSASVEGREEGEMVEASGGGCAVAMDEVEDAVAVAVSVSVLVFLASCLCVR